jgi:NADPH:quinone reductase-like Zn-dependent oxidoreductase
MTLAVTPHVATTMRAAVIRAHGPSDTLRLEEVPTPRPGPGQLLVQVGAVGLNHLDVFARQGLTGPGVHAINLPHVSGVDVAGVVAAHGPGVDSPPVGERVLVDPAIGCGSCRQCRRGELSMCPEYSILGEHRWGGLADYVVVPACNVIALPAHIPFTQAAAVPAAYTTAWRGVITTGRLQPGERMLVVGASGGVGCAALQIGVLMGAEVVAVAGSQAKRQRARELGAVAAFDSGGDWLSDVLDWTAGDGVDVVHDAVGAPTWRNSIRALAMGGRLVICGATGGDRPDISIREIYQHHRQILGAPMGNWQDFLNVSRLMFSGQLQPEVYRVYPLDRLGEAEDALEARAHFGKIVVSVNSL